MIGGNSFGVNNASLGNIIIALNMYKFYIKLKKNDDNKIYYFVFDLNNNNDLVNSFGLTDTILTNGNTPLRNSKTFLDLNGAKEKKFIITLKGIVYNSPISSQFSSAGSEIEFIESSGAKGTLKISVAKKENTDANIPIFELIIGEMEEQIFRGESYSTPLLPMSRYNLNSLINQLKEVKNEYDAIDSTNVVLKQATLIRLKTREDELFSSINHLSINEFSDNDLVYLYKYLVGNKDLREKYATKSSVILEKIKQRDAENKNHLLLDQLKGVSVIQPPTIQDPTIQTQLTMQQQLDNIKNKVIVKLRNEILHQIIDQYKYIKNVDGTEKLISPSNEGTKKLIKKYNLVTSNNAKNSINQLYEFLKTNNYINLENNALNENGEKISNIFYNFIVYLISRNHKSESIISAEELSDILNMINETVLTNPSDSVSKLFSTSLLNYLTKQMHIEEATAIAEAAAATEEAETYGQEEGLGDMGEEGLGPETSMSISGEKNARQFVQFGGGDINQNAIIILENNTTNLDISEFAEPVIYLVKDTSNLENVRTMGSDNPNIPVFGYLTVGKPLLLKLLEIQTNQRVSFAPEDSKYKKAINTILGFMQANPILTGGIVTSMLNELSIKIKTSELPYAENMPILKDALKTIITHIIGPNAAGWAVWLLSDAPKPVAEATLEQNVAYTGGKKQKSRKNNIKRTKKQTRKSK